VISRSAFAQVKKEPVTKDKPVNFKALSDSLNQELSWNEIFKSSGWDCRCPLTPEQVQQMPRELHPYQWIDRDKSIVVDESTFKKLVKSDFPFIKVYHKADSLLNRQKPKLPK